MKINYVFGDATKPQGNGVKIIPHIVNDEGRWGAGFVLAISNRWKTPEQFYRAMPEYILGDARIINVDDDIWVANMVGQHTISYDEQGLPPIRYDAVREALSKVNAIALEMNATLHMPRIGCGLAGGCWEEIEKILNGVVTVDVTVYDFK